MNDNAESNEGEKLKQAEELLRSRLNGRVRELRVLIHDRNVVLQGYTFSYHDKQLAQHVAMGAFCLPIRANEIEVRPQPKPAGGENTEQH